MNGQVDPLLFACEACARDHCLECVHLTVGAWCPHACWWLDLYTWEIT